MGDGGCTGASLCGDGDLASALLEEVEVERIEEGLTASEVEGNGKAPTAT